MYVHNALGEEVLGVQKDHIDKHLMILLCKLGEKIRPCFITSCTAIKFRSIR